MINIVTDLRSLGDDASAYEKDALQEIERLRKALEDIGMEPSGKDKYGTQNYDATAYELRRWARDALNNK